MPRRKTPRTAVMNTREAAIYLGLSESTLEKMRGSANGPPFASLDSAIRYRVVDLDGWLAGRVHRSIPERKRRERERHPDQA